MNDEEPADTITVELTVDEAITAAAAAHVMAQGATNSEQGFTLERRGRLCSSRDKLLVAAGAPVTKVVKP